MKRILGVLLGATALVLTVTGGVASGQLANEELLCRADDPTMDKYGYLRSLFLDLAGTVPTPADYARLDDVEDVPESMIDELLAGEAFVERAVRIHQSFLWNNVENVALLNYRTAFRISGGLYWRTRPAFTYRGDFVPCRNEPATFDANGDPIFVDEGEDVRREGYVEVAPYWDPTQTIRVCAADAQTRAVSPTGSDCRTNSGFNDPKCGCGPNLNLCRYGNYSAIARAMAEDVDRRIASVIREDRAHTDLFTSRQAFVNGPLVHFLRHQTFVPAGVSMEPLSYEPDRLPELAYAGDYDRWEEIQVADGHAGVLTSPAFLLRFQTNRARASRFFEAFLCQPFSPPPGGLPGADPNAPPHPDLQQRDGCKYCHALLEPAAAYWGRWAERGAGFLDPQRYPESREDCLTCAMSGQLCSRECRLFYVTRPASSLEMEYAGSLNAYNFLRPAHRRHVERGPELLVATAIVDDRFPRCMARRAMEGFFGRPLADDETEWLEALGRSFVSGDYRYRALVKAIVTSPVYRRVR